MRVFGTWNGGHSYGTGDVFTDMETWPSLGAARDALRARANGGGWPVDDGAHVVDFAEDGYATVGHAVGRIAYPAVSENTEIMIYAAQKVGARWSVVADYPMIRLCLGPRGGVRSESC